MEIPRISPLTGLKNYREIPVSEENLVKWYDRKMTTDALCRLHPDITPDDIEFLRSGLTPEDWNELADIQADARMTEHEPIDYDLHPYELEIQ